MKTQLVLFFIGAVFALLLPSCTIIVDDNNRLCGIAQQPIHVGTGMSPRGPIRGVPIVTGGAVFGACGPQGPYAQGGIRTHTVPRQWGQVNPFGPGCYPQHGRQQPPPMFGYPPQNYNRAAAGQASWCPPNYGPQPANYNPRSGRWQ